MGSVQAEAASMECTAPQATLGELDVGFISNGGHGCYWVHTKVCRRGKGGEVAWWCVRLCVCALVRCLVGYEGWECGPRLYSGLDM